MLAVALRAFRPSRARAANAFDGTWAGVDANGETVQMTFTDGRIIGFYWRGDYLDATGGKVGGGGTSLSFSFTGGQAVVSRGGVGMAIVIHDKRGETRVDLKKD
jgi:hypothetical protein